ncbi:TPA: GNAT family N-acetyltransferase [Streptococcus suis]
MEIKLANLDDIDEIVKFHKEQFSDYYLTQLGSSILSRYYTFFITSSVNNCFVVLEKNKIIALALFVNDFEFHISKFYANNKVFLATSIIKALLGMNRIVWKGTAERVMNLFRTSEKAFDLPKLTLLSLAVSNCYRGNGIGKKLINFAEEFYIDKEIKSYYLSVLSSNYDAIRFYEKNGFNKMNSDSRLYYMEKVLL